MALKAIAVKNAKPKEKDYKLYDEKGLFLLVKCTGAKYWRFKYRYGGKERLLALGVYPDVGLKNAHDKRDEARTQLANDIDPNEAKRAKKAAQAEAGENTFEVVAHEWFNTKMRDKSESHRKRTWRALEKDLFPQLGRLSVANITPPQLLSALRKIESRGAIETAHRAKQTAGQIFRFAIASGRAERDPSNGLGDALKVPTEKHHAAITAPKEVGRLLVAIDGFQGTATVKAALSLSPMLLLRPGELRHTEWREINWEESQLEIPAERMKMNLPHIVPLCRQALTILEEHRLLTGRGRYVFPSARGASRPLSEGGVRTALRTMGYSNDMMTPHGFRATARTLLDEVLEYRVDWIEHQLAHAVRDANGRAYNRTTHLAQRKEMMQKWADYLAGLKGQAATVIN